MPVIVPSYHLPLRKNLISTMCHLPSVYAPSDGASAESADCTSDREGMPQSRGESDSFQSENESAARLPRPSDFPIRLGIFLDRRINLKDVHYSKIIRDKVCLLFRNPCIIPCLSLSLSPLASNRLSEAGRALKSVCLFLIRSSDDTHDGRGGQTRGGHA